MTFDLPRDEATGWFDRLYHAADRDPRAVPWADLEPNPELATWLGEQPRRGRAVVVGCGLGDDAEAVARSGYQTTAFDVSREAIDWCRERFPDSPVDYRVADLLDLPDDVVGVFDLVVEVRTIQSLPLVLRSEAITATTSLLDDGGTAFVMAWSRPDDTTPSGPPWPLSPAEMAGFLELGLVLESDRSSDGHFVWVLRRPTE